jgi:hypothetical protein
MTWVTWHQHRREALISLVFLAAIAIVLVYSGLQMRAFATTINQHETQAGASWLGSQAQLRDSAIGVRQSIGVRRLSMA